MGAAPPTSPCLLDKAIALHPQVLQKRKRMLGPDPAETLNSRSDLAAVYQAAGKLALEEPLLRDLLARLRARDGAEAPSTANVLGELGVNLLAQNHFAEAEKALRQCVAIRAKTQPEEWTTFEARSLLGSALAGQKQYAAAEPWLLQGYEGLKQRAVKIPAANKTCLTEAAERLVQLYQAWGNADAAARWRNIRDGKNAPQPRRLRSADAKR